MRIPIPLAYEDFWAAGEQANPQLQRRRFLEAFAFGDSEPLSAELAELVLRGVKRATASLVWTFEHDKKPQPKPGDLSIVTAWVGEPLCIIETTRVEVLPFDEVSQDFADSEGEDHGSLDAWKNNHAAFFARECARIGRTPQPRMPVVCESFRVVFQPPRGCRAA